MEIRVRGRVQGVGFRPTVWRFARELGLVGEVLNDGDGVLMRVGGSLATIDASSPVSNTNRRRWRASTASRPAPTTARCRRNSVSPKASTAPRIRRLRRTRRSARPAPTEIADPFERRYRYPFANCTHCGPRLSIVTGIPYDRANTTMAAFAMCAACEREYRDPADRRFHAEAIACHACGPQARLIRFDGRAIELRSTFDARRRRRRWRPDQEGRDRRDQGSRRIPPRLRRDQRRGRRAAAPAASAATPSRSR